MFKKFLQGGRAFEVEIRNSSYENQVIIRLEEETEPINRVPIDEFRLLGPDRFRLRSAGVIYEGRYRIDDGVYHLSLDGKTYRVTAPGPDDNGISWAASHRAPMPGKVLAVAVEVGRRVERDAVILVLEAMKMEHSIRATHAGRVKQLHVSAGDLVGMDAALFELDPEEE